MIAPARPARPRPTAASWQTFLAMLPAIVQHARIAFTRVRSDNYDDLIQETVANAAVAFARLSELGKQDLAYPSVLAKYAVARSGKDGAWATA